MAAMRRARGVEIMADGRLAHQAGPMRHELAERDRLLAEGVSRMKVGKIRLDGRVEIDLTLLDQLHESQVGVKLGNGADAIDRLCSCRRLGAWPCRSPRPRPFADRRPE